MSKKKIAKILSILSFVLILIAVVSLAASMLTLTKTMSASLFAEDGEEPFQVNITAMNLTTGTIAGVASLRITGGGLMSTNVSATLDILDAQGNLLFSGSNTTVVSPNEVKYLTMRFSLSGIDFFSLSASVRLSFRTFFNLVGIEIYTELLGGD